ncbi:MAG TPA: hypothetical protein VFE90_01595, partial [Myxococcales bacterium]|nr:hypothetical protein [Myxococcales bacterium]
ADTTRRGSLTRLNRALTWFTRLNLSRDKLAPRSDRRYDRLRGSLTRLNRALTWFTRLNLSRDKLAPWPRAPVSAGLPG